MPKTPRTSPIRFVFHSRQQLPPVRISPNGHTWWPNKKIDAISSLYRPSRRQGCGKMMPTKLVICEESFSRIPHLAPAADHIWPTASTSGCLAILMWFSLGQSPRIKGFGLPWLCLTLPPCPIPPSQGQANRGLHLDRQAVGSHAGRELFELGASVTLRGNGACTCECYNYVVSRQCASPDGICLPPHPVSGIKADGWACDNAGPW